jgi:hypothetical protein
MSVIEQKETPVSDERGMEHPESINQNSVPLYFKQCSENRDLLKDVTVVVPVRPEGGLNVKLAQMLSIWYGEGTSWSMLNDHMGGFIEAARANIAYTFLKERTEKYLLMIDNDMEPPINLPWLLARHDLPVVGVCAMVHTHKWGPQLCFTIKDTEDNYRFPTMMHSTIPEKGVVPVGHIGTGALLIRRDVLEAFTFKNGDVPFYVPEDIRVEGVSTGNILIGEDISFCNQIMSKGFQPYVDLEAHCGHRKTVALRWPEERIDPDLNAETWVLPTEGQMIRNT